MAAARLGPPPAPLTLDPTLLVTDCAPVRWGMLVLATGFGIAAPMFQLMLAFTLNLLLRKPWLSWCAYVLLPVTVGLTADAATPAVIVLGLVRVSVLALLLSRVGLLATASFMSVVNLLSLAPLTTDLSAWYAPQGVVVALIIIGLAVYGFVVSVGAKRLALRGFFGDE